MRTIPALQFGSGSAASVDKGSAVVTVATIAANVNVTGAGVGANIDAQLPTYNADDFNANVDVYHMGILLRNGDDVNIGNDPATGDLKFAFILEDTETIIVVVRR